MNIFVLTAKDPADFHEMYARILAYLEEKGEEIPPNKILNIACRARGKSQCAYAGNKRKELPVGGEFARAEIVISADPRLRDSNFLKILKEAVHKFATGEGGGVTVTVVQRYR